jgi:hypothetical protein
MRVPEPPRSAGVRNVTLDSSGRSTSTVTDFASKRFAGLVKDLTEGTGAPPPERNPRARGRAPPNIGLAGALSGREVGHMRGNWILLVLLGAAAPARAAVDTCRQTGRLGSLVVRAESRAWPPGSTPSAARCAPTSRSRWAELRGPAGCRLTLRERALLRRWCTRWTPSPSTPRRARAGVPGAGRRWGAAHRLTSSSASTRRDTALVRDLSGRGTILRRPGAGSRNAVPGRVAPLVAARRGRREALAGRASRMSRCSGTRREPGLAPLPQGRGAAR